MSVSLQPALLWFLKALPEFQLQPTLSTGNLPEHSTNQMKLWFNPQHSDSTQDNKKH